MHTIVDEVFRLTESTHGPECQRCILAAQQGASLARVTGSRESTSKVSARTDGGEGPMIGHSATVKRIPPRADHDPIVEAYQGTRYQPAEVTVTCAAEGCGWTFESQESIGGPVEAWGPAWEDHLEEVG